MLMTRSLLAPSLFACLMALAFGGCIIVDGDGDDTGADTGNSSNTNGSADETGGNAEQVAACRSACDDLQFFSCITADEFAACYSACDEKGGSDLDLFIACVGNTIPSCDEAYPCYENLIAAEPPDGGSGDSGGGGGSCADSCEEWLAAGCEPFVETPSCVDNRDGCTLPPECNFEGGGM